MPWSHSLGGGCDRGISISAVGRCFDLRSGGGLGFPVEPVQAFVNRFTDQRCDGCACALAVDSKLLALLFRHVQIYSLQWLSSKLELYVCRRTRTRIYALLVFVKGAKDDGSSDGRRKFRRKIRKIRKFSVASVVQVLSW